MTSKHLGKLILIGVVLIAVFSYVVFRAWGGTLIDLTLTSNASLEQGLVGHWSMDGSTMFSNVGDSSGQGNNGKLSGQTSTTTVPGRIGQALSFDGVDDYVSVPSSSAFDFTASGGFSYFTWFKKDTTCSSPEGTTEVFTNRFGSDHGVKTWWFGCATGGATPGKLAIDLIPGGAEVGGYVHSQNAVNDGAWHHGGWVYDGSANEVRLYLDGVLQGASTTAFTVSFNVANPICLGSYGTNCNGKDDDGYAYDADGLFDDARAYNRALSAAEISRLYNLGATTHINTTLNTNPDLGNGLVGHWTFDAKNVNGINVIDRSPSENSGTFVGGTTTVTYTSTGSQTFTIPTGITNIEVKAWGSGGGGGGGGSSGSGGAGGGGGFVTGNISVTSGETLDVFVGGGGGGGAVPDAFSGDAGGGGGSSRVARGSTLLFAAAAGGGGGGGDNTTSTAGGAGGVGGGSTGGTAGSSSLSTGGGGGTQSAGGAAGDNNGNGSPGAAGASLSGGGGAQATAWSCVTGTTGGGGTAGSGDGGAGGNAFLTGGCAGGGGGGGGYFGGGGGGASTPSDAGGGGGGGGSSFATGTTASATSTSSGSGTSAGNTGDADYADNAGQGGAAGGTYASGSAGNPGRIVIKYASLPAAVPGRIGQALSFDGVDDYVGISTALIGNSSSFAISAWVNCFAADQVNNRCTVYNEYPSGGGNPQIYFQISENVDGDIEFGVLDDSSVFGGCSQTAIDLTGTGWHHVVGVQNSKSSRAIFIDGVQQCSNTTTIGTLTNNRTAIGSRQHPDAFLQYFNGPIDDVRVYNRALSAAEISRLYNLGATTHINTTLNTNPDLGNGLIGHWSFDGKDMSTVLSESFSGSTFPPTTTCTSGWTTGGNANWTRDTGTSNTAPASANSGVVADAQSTWIDCNITLSVPAELTFRWKVSSESGYDFLNFCYDDDSCTRTAGFDQQISGEVDWTTVTKAMTAGTHSLRWLFARDGADPGGTDEGWIDDISIDAYLATDRSGQSNTGTSTGVFLTPGRIGQAILFDGVDDDDYVNVGDNSSLQLTGAMTVSAWVNTSSASNNGRIVSKVDWVGTPNKGWELVMEGNSDVNFYLMNTSGTYFAVNVAAQPTEEWRHYVAVYKPSTSMEMYVNGVSGAINTTSIPSAIANSDYPVYIGSRPDFNCCEIAGAIDDVRVYNRALSAAEILRLYQLGK